MYPSRTEGTGTPRACRTAPDAFVCPMPVSMLARRREWTRRSVRRRTAPFAVILVIDVLVLHGRAMGAGMPIAMIAAVTTC